MIDIVGTRWGVIAAIFVVCAFFAFAPIAFMNSKSKFLSMLSRTLIVVSLVSMFIFTLIATTFGSYDYKIKTYNNPVVAAADGYKSRNSQAQGTAVFHSDVFKNEISKVSGVEAISFDKDRSDVASLEEGGLVDFIGVKNNAKISGSVYFTKDKMIVLLDKDNTKEQERFEVETK